MLTGCDPHLPTLWETLLPQTKPANYKKLSVKIKITAKFISLDADRQFGIKENKPKLKHFCFTTAFSKTIDLVKKDVPTKPQFPIFNPLISSLTPHSLHFLPPPFFQAKFLIPLTQLYLGKLISPFMKEVREGVQAMKGVHAAMPKKSYEVFSSVSTVDLEQRICLLGLD